MVEGAVCDLLAFYQRELRERPEGPATLKKLQITSPEVAEHFQLGYSSGRAVAAAGEKSYQDLVKLRLAFKHRECFQDCVVIPVFDESGALVDLCGLMPYPSGLRYKFWQEPMKGLVGAGALKVYPEIILCENVLHALHVRQHGFPNVVALRKPEELAGHLPLLAKHGVERVLLVSPLRNKVLMPVLEKAGIEVKLVQVSTSQMVVPREALEVAQAEESVRRKVPEAKLVSRSEGRLHFEVEGTEYKLDAAAISGLGIRAVVRAERGGANFLDKADLASAGSRKKFARPCSLRLGLPVRDVEDHLGAIAARIDELEMAAAKERSRAPRELSELEREAALEVLKGEDVLARQAAGLERCFGLVAEEGNKKLALLVAASRLLDRPLGAIVRGPAGCGKSALIQAASRVLPGSEVLNFSRLTAQSLFFLPPEVLSNRVLVVDEYTGMEESEYAVRTMMSSQSLSLAITVREGGRMPVTKTMEIPARLAVLVSTTQPVNVENLSRFIELKMDDSPEQTRLVMEGMAAAHGAGLSDDERSEELRQLQNAAQLLRRCAVEVSFAGKLVYASANVLARRQFAQVMGLIAAHAALFQYQRQCREADGLLTVRAEKKDYEAVYPLLGHVVEHFEEAVSPAGMELLRRIEEKDARMFTRREAMGWTGWSYSKTYRVLQELSRIDLLVADNQSSGSAKVYEPAPFFKTSGGITQIAPPERL